MIWDADDEGSGALIRKSIILRRCSCVSHLVLNTPLPGISFTVWPLGGRIFLCLKLNVTHLAWLRLRNYLLVLNNYLSKNDYCNWNFFVNFCFWYLDVGKSEGENIDKSSIYFHLRCHREPQHRRLNVFAMGDGICWLVSNLTGREDTILLFTVH